MRRMSKRMAAVLTTLAVAAVCNPVMAHKVNIFAYEEEGTVYTESYFVDGTPCRQSPIVVYDNEKQVLTKGKTDEEGLFSFRIDDPADIRIVLEASMGHRNEMKLAASKMSGGLSRKTDKERRAAQATDAAPIPSQEASSRIEESPVGSCSYEIRAIVKEMLGDQLTPIQKEIADLRRLLEKPGLTDIIGGLGWIIGLAGAYLWGASRRRRL